MAYMSFTMLPSLTGQCHLSLDLTVLQPVKERDLGRLLVEALVQAE